MSTLLEQASLVMIPSGYKEDIVYSQIPTSGAGDLSFTRASNGTRVNSAGLIEVVPWNLVQQSETLSVSPWGIADVTITDNSQTAPNGTTSADVLTEGTGSAQHRIYQTTSFASGIYTLSVYVKNITGTRQAYIDLGPVTGFFNFATETIYSASAIATFEKLANGWYRIALTTANAITLSTIYLGLGQSNSETYTGNGTSAIAFWGAQLNIGSTAKPYFPTTDRLNVPRLTYQNGGGGCPSLLLEKQSTNLIPYSEQFDNAVHYKLDVTITANNITSPDGTQNADKFTETTGTGEHIVYDIDSNATGTYTLSAFFKGGAGTIYPVLRLNGSITTEYAGCIFNTSTGAVVNTFYNTYSAPTTKVENMGNGWYRVSMTTTTTDANFGMRIAASNSTSPSIGDFGAISYTGSTSNYFYAWGAQLEASSYPTSYIPTTSSSATRVADECKKLSISSLIGQSEGTLYFDGIAIGETEICNINRSIQNSVFLYASLNTVRAYVYADGTGLNLLSSVSSSTRFKAAIAYKSNSIAFYVNGTLITQVTSATFTPNVTMENFFIANGGYVQGKEQVNCNQVVIFPTRLTNSELASLTTI